MKMTRYHCSYLKTNSVRTSNDKNFKRQSRAWRPCTLTTYTQNNLRYQRTFESYFDTKYHCQFLQIVSLTLQHTFKQKTSAKQTISNIIVIGWLISCFMKHFHVNGDFATCRRRTSLELCFGSMQFLFLIWVCKSRHYMYVV
jgi:hypothetical protein